MIFSHNKTQNMKINLRGCRWERRVSPTTRENSIEPPIKTQYIFSLITTHNFYVFYSKYFTITEYENKPN